MIADIARIANIFCQSEEFVWFSKKLRALSVSRRSLTQWACLCDWWKAKSFVSFQNVPDWKITTQPGLIEYAVYLVKPITGKKFEISSLHYLSFSGSVFCLRSFFVSFFQFVLRSFFQRVFCFFYIDSATDPNHIINRLRASRSIRRNHLQHF